MVRLNKHDIFLVLVLCQAPLTAIYRNKILSVKSSFCLPLSCALSEVYTVTILLYILMYTGLDPTIVKVYIYIDPLIGVAHQFCGAEFIKDGAYILGIGSSSSQRAIHSQGFSDLCKVFVICYREKKRG